MFKPPMTLQGANRLKELLQQLKTIERPRLATAIATAREYGDLRENSEYKAAREAQSFCEGRIREIEHSLATAEIIDLSKIPTPDCVTFGAFVRLFREKDEEEVVYQIVGDAEADIRRKHLAISCPLARGLIGKKTGDIATISAPSGNQIYEILEFSLQPLTVNPSTSGKTSPPLSQ